MGAVDKLPADVEWDYNVKMYTALIPDLKKYGVICCLENMFTRYRGKIVEAICSDFDEAVAYIDHLNGVAGEKLFGFCLDVGHATLLGKDIAKVIRTLGDRITVLHVHDNDGANDEHLFPYMGATNWDRFCEGMKVIGYDKPMSFETFNALATFDKALWPQMLKLLSATGELFASRIKN